MLRKQHGTSPLVAELQAIWDSIDADPILRRLVAYRWTGRPGHPLRALWRSYVASYHLNLPNTNSLVRRLQDDYQLCEACGFATLPSRWTFNRFFSRLSKHADLLRNAMDALTEALAKRLPGFGETVAVDSTTVRTHANPNHGTDLDASWTAKAYNKNKKDKREWYYGYKLHLTIDAATELPIEAHVTTASRADTKEMLPSLEHARARFGWFKPKVVVADKGYDAKENFEGIAENIGALPIIDVRKLGTVRGQERESRPCEAYSVITPSGLRYKCERRPWEPKCQRFGQCPLLPVFVDSPMNSRDLLPAYERYSLFPYGSKEWKTIYAKRSAVERVNSRLKECRRLEKHCFRSLAKVTAHAFLSVVTTQATALAKVVTGDLSFRTAQRKVA